MRRAPPPVNSSMLLLTLFGYVFYLLVVMTTTFPPLSTFFRPEPLLYPLKFSLKSLSEKFHHTPPFFLFAPVLLSLPPLLIRLKKFQTPPLLVIPLPLRRRFTNACSFEKNWYGRLFTMNPPHFIVVSSFVAIHSRLLVVVVAEPVTSSSIAQKHDMTVDNYLHTLL